MNQENLSTLFKITILTFLFLIEKSSCVDPQFEACEPKSCGILKNISYPFWIQGQTESYCGFPGFFNITCNNDLPVLHIPDNDYIIHQIYYNNQSLRVSNYAVLDTNDQCFPPIKNVTVGEQFEYVYNNISIYNNITLLSKCSSPLPEELLRYNIGCGEDWVLALFGNDKNLSAALEKCDTEIVQPIELYSENEISDGNYKGILKRGFELEWRASDCSACSKTGGRCGFNSSSMHFRCFCPDRPHAWHCTPGRNKTTVILATVIPAAAAGIVIFIILSFFIIRSKSSLGKSMIFWGKKTENYRSIEVFLEGHGTLAPKRCNFSEVKKMTNNFKVKLGQGGYGSVYKGNLPNGCLVAVKVLNESKGGGEEFINEVASISRTSHVNIVTLLGFCFEGSKRALIYEFLPNGSLEKFIYEANSLTERTLSWGTLFQISVGIARGLEYLHRGCKTRILHFDIKPHNILLDEDFCPKISDFGLAKLCPRKESIVSMLGARGTAGYIAPEVFCRNFGGVSHKSDVYSYGMMVMEMVGGRKNIDVGVDHTSEIYFPHWIYKRVEQEEELGLRGIKNDQERESAKKMIVVSLWCIQTNPSDRPSMSRVVEMLEGSVQSLEVPPKPFLSSPSRTSPESSGTLLP